MILQEKLDSGEIIVLDGGTGTEIARLGVKTNNSAWSGVANKTHPDIVQFVHEEYIRAGVNVITANTFSTCRHVLAGAGLDEETVEINRRAVQIAHRARDAAAHVQPVAVAGSMSNMVAWKEGTTSPELKYFPTPEQEVSNYREMAETLAEAGVDVILLEMMLDVERASRAMAAAVATGLPVWVGISCSQHADGRMVGWDIANETVITTNYVPPDPLPLDQIISSLRKMGGQVFGIMHSSLNSTSLGLDVLLEHWEGPAMVYPETMVFRPKTHTASVTVTPEDFAKACNMWVSRGVQILGGCCGTTIEHIRHMVARLPTSVRSESFEKTK